MSQRFRIRADVDDLWQTVQPGPFSEKQPQWLTLQLCLVTVGVDRTRQDDDDDDDDDDPSLSSFPLYLPVCMHTHALNTVVHNML